MAEILDLKKRTILYTQKSSVTKHRCAWGTCNSDSRFYHKRLGLKMYSLSLFQSQKLNKNNCMKWIRDI